MVLRYSKMIDLGTIAPDFCLMGIDGEQHTLADYSGARVLVMIFMCNHCPYVQKIWPDLIELAKKAPEGVQFLGINSNGGNPAYPEDSFEKMKEYATERGQSFPYLLDGEQTAARAYGAECTPDIFVYGADRKLAYRGAFEGVAPAIEALLKGQTPEESQVHSMGCSIKWVA